MQYLLNGNKSFNHYFIYGKKVYVLWCVLNWFILFLDFHDIVYGQLSKWAPDYTFTMNTEIALLVLMLIWVVLFR
jgi:hypothetical protein